MIHYLRIYTEATIASYGEEIVIEDTRILPLVPGMVPVPTPILPPICHENVEACVSYILSKHTDNGSTLKIEVH